jgi:hypothetical protein
MKHAGADALRQLSPLLAELRKRGALREKSSGVFYFKSKAFLHFHEDPAGLFADLRVAEEWVRLPVNTPSEWTRVLEMIDRKLAATDSGM